MKSRINVNIYGKFCHYCFSKLYISRFLGVLGHETLHAVNDDGTENPYSEEIKELENQGLSQKEINDEMEKRHGEEEEYKKQVEEDKNAHLFDTNIWGVLKSMFKIENTQMDNKLYALLTDDGENNFFDTYLDYNYSLGGDFSTLIDEKQDYENKRAFFKAIREKYPMPSNEKNESQTDESGAEIYKTSEVDEIKAALAMFYSTRQIYLDDLEENNEMYEYELEDFNDDMTALCDKKFDVSQEEFDKVINNQIKDHSSKDYSDFVMTETEVKNSISSSLDRVFSNMLGLYSLFLSGEDTEGKFGKALNNFDIVNEKLYKSFVDNRDSDHYGEGKKYSNGRDFFLEMTHIKDSDGNFQSMTFLEYYVNYADNVVMNDLADNMEGINIKFEGKNTHMVANEYLFNDVLSDMKTVLTENYDNSELSSFTIIDGFRPRGKTSGSHHCYNNAFDIFNITYKDENGITKTIGSETAEKVELIDNKEKALDMIKFGNYMAKQGNYKYIELKNFNGFHFGRDQKKSTGNYNTKVYMGNWPGTSGYTSYSYLSAITGITDPKLLVKYAEKYYTLKNKKANHNSKTADFFVSENKEEKYDDISEEVVNILLKYSYWTYNTFYILDTEKILEDYEEDNSESND